MYFLDTYAMVEYFRDNPKFTKRLENETFCTSDYQLMELYYISLRENGLEHAEKHFESFALCKIQIPENTLKNAMKKRLELQKKGLDVSYVDAIGYQYALENGLIFLTGDSAFKNLDKEHVAYIK